MGVNAKAAWVGDGMDDHVRPKLDVLLVEDDEAYVELIREGTNADEAHPIRLTVCETLPSALEAIAQRRFDAILVASTLADSKGIARFEQLCKAAADAPILLLAGRGDEATASRSVELGAQDCLVKGRGAGLIAWALHNTVARAVSQKALVASQKRNAHLLRVLRGVREVRELIVRERDRREFVQQVCDILTEKMGYHIAWIALGDGITPVSDWAGAGCGEGFNPLAEALGRGTWPDCRAALNASRDGVVVLDPEADCLDCPQWKQYQHNQAVVTALRQGDVLLGMLGVSVPREMALDEEDRDLIIGVASDVAFALHNIEQNRVALEAVVEQHNAEDARLAEMQRAQRYLDIASVILLAIDRAGIVTMINQKGCDVLGYPEAEIVGKNWFDNFLPPQVREQALSVAGALLAGELDRATYQENEVLTRTGGTRLIAWRNTVVRDQEGAIVAHLSSGQDITERKAAEEALRASEAQQRMLLQNLPQKVFFKDRQSVYLSCNESFARDLGISPDDIAGKTDHDFFSRDLADKYRADDARLMDSGQSEDIEERYVDDGRDTVIHTVKTPVRDEEGKVCGILGIFWDITEQRRVEAQLRQAQKLESVGTLAGGIAHDFNNMLTVIKGCAELAHNDLRELDPVRQYVAEIACAADRAATLTRQLLAFSRKQVLLPEILNLNSVVTGIEPMLRRLLGENLDIEVRRSDALGNVMADPGQMEQVIVNLAVNARDAMREGGTLTIETGNTDLGANTIGPLDTMKPGNYVLLSVSDTGCGMDAATRERIFEPFFTTKEAGKGTGMGLATVYGIVKQSGGNIRVDSEPGLGTTFRIYLPRVDARTTERRLSVTPPTKRVCETVLIVEDEDAVRRLTKRILSNAGYQVLTASNGGEALRMHGQVAGSIDLLLTDVVMPEMSGPELSRRLERLRPEMMTLYMSGYTDDLIAHHGVLEPGVRILAKPFSATALIRKVREVLEGG